MAKPEAFVYNAKLKRVVDGDTIDAYIDLGFDVWVTKRIRFKGVDTWEKRTRNKQEKILGLAATAYTTEQLEKNEGKFLISSYLTSVIPHSVSISLNIVICCGLLKSGYPSSER